MAVDEFGEVRRGVQDAPIDPHTGKLPAGR
jgi:hypothetical protein